MLTYRDCVDMSELTEDEIDMIANYFGLSSLAALCLGETLLQNGDRVESLYSMFQTGLIGAHGQNDLREFERLKAAIDRSSS